MRKLLLLAVAAAALLVLPALAGAHPERNTFFPDPAKGQRPTWTTKGQQLVVCKGDSAKRIRRIYAGRKRAKTRRQRLALVRRCRFRHIQAAVDRARSGARILVLPGVYREEPSRRVPFNDPKCAPDNPRYWEETNDGHGENGKVPTYEFHVDCKNSRNLIQVLGDSPGDPDRECDQRCNLQIEGMGRRALDVVIVADRIKRDAIRADRADGFKLRRVTTQEASFNGVDVVETNGFRLERLVARWNQNYGILTFTDDHGLYDTIEAYGNGDSGVYPGSGPEGGCKRYGIEIRRVNSYGNVLGYSGTAGNGVWIHDVRFHHNAAGIATDSFVPGHPGMPQDCSKWTNNDIYSNNVNYFSEANQDYCSKTEFKDRPQKRVCPQFQVPVGTGMMIYGGNDNLMQRNRVWDNWRNGFRQFWVPASIRGENDPAKQQDTSNGNKYLDNVMSVGRDGRADLNGVDFYWDEQGQRNCWQGNRGPNGGKVSTDPSSLPNCDSGGSRSPGANFAKLGPEVPCANWHPRNNPRPPGCNWFDVPPEPKSR